MVWIGHNGDSTARASSCIGNNLTATDVQYFTALSTTSASTTARSRPRTWRSCMHQERRSSANRSTTSASSATGASTKARPPSHTTFRGMAISAHASTNGSTLPQWVSGKFGYALKFDGSSSLCELRIPLPATLHRSFTISLWFKPTATIIVGVTGPARIYCL